MINRDSLKRTHPIRLHPGLPAAFAVGFLLLLAGCKTAPGDWSSARSGRAVSGIIAKASARGGTNGAAIAMAARQLPAAQREGLAFLLENMPERDLQRLPPALLLENVTLAYEALAAAPWRERLPREIFLNDVLPYASLNERRDAWRPRLRELCVPLVADCRTPAEAAHRLNQKLFKLVKVRYSTARRRADQGPFETMESGLATCTGLSILLVDACRSVGVPARVVATPLWTNLRGNHTWVEIWDGDWHFAGAAEPDAKGLDRGWFRHDASHARKDEPLHAIYASSFKNTGLTFPLVWAPHVDWVSAVNVTDRYAVPGPPAETGQVRLLVKALDRPDGARVAARVRVSEALNATTALEGTTRNESADMNDMLALDVARGRTYEVAAEFNGRVVHRLFRAGAKPEEIIVLHFDGPPGGGANHP